jgi:deoxycytidine triphosphate deaminase
LSDLSAHWIDPDDSAPAGILLSDRIRLYVESVALITPFTESNLSPASYDLTVGSEFAYHENVKKNGKATCSLSPGENLVIPPNSIVFVTTAEALNLPFYLVARFNLKLRYLHQGLLVGTGPQIDPGFSGQLSCPLHNISGEKISLAAGSAFAVVEFQKTTRFAERAQFTDTDTLEDIRERGERAALLGVANWPCKTFPRGALRRRAVESYLPAGKSVSSSLEGLASDLRELQSETAKTLAASGQWMRTINVGSSIAVAVVALSLIGSVIALVSWYRGIADASFRAEEKVKVLETQKDALAQRVGQLELHMNRLRLDPTSALPVDANGNRKAEP